MNMSDHLAGSAATCRKPVSNATFPLLVGDAIHVLSQKVFKAMVMQDDETLSSLAAKQLKAGAQALAVNLGPGKEMGKMTPWVVETINKITEKPLFFSANIIAHEQLLKFHGNRIAINAVTANHKDLLHALTVAGEYGCSLVVLLVQSGKMASGLDERIQIASDVLEQAVLKGFPLNRLYLDPVLSCRPDPNAWHISKGLPDVGSAVEAITLIRELDRNVKTIIALGNGSEGVAKEKKSSVHSRILSLFVEAGLDSVLLNCFDNVVMRRAQGIRTGDSQFCMTSDGNKVHRAA